jgi:hypothetical protein
MPAAGTAPGWAFGAQCSHQQRMLVGQTSLACMSSLACVRSLYCLHAGVGCLCMLFQLECYQVFTTTRKNPAQQPSQCLRGGSDAASPDVK